MCLRALRVCLGGFVYAYYGLEYLCIGVGVCILGVEVAVYKNQYLLLLVVSCNEQSFVAIRLL